MQCLFFSAQKVLDEHRTNLSATVQLRCWKRGSKQGLEGEDTERGKERRDVINKFIEHCGLRLCSRRLWYDMCSHMFLCYQS